MKKSMLMSLMFIALGGCGDQCYGRSVEGHVVSASKRITAHEEKVAVRLKPYHADDTVERIAGGTAGLDIECVSTRCSNLQPGDCVSLTCKHIVTGLDEPDVIGCKMLRTIACD